MIAGYVGTDPVERIYLGDELIWSAEPPVDYSSLPFTYEFETPQTISGMFMVTQAYLFIQENTGLTMSFYDVNGDLIRTDTVIGADLYNGPVPQTPVDNVKKMEVIIPGELMVNQKLFVKNSYIQGNYKVYGNILSLAYGDNFTNYTSYPSGWTSNNGFFYDECPIFEVDNNRLTDASNLILADNAPAKIYFRMFSGCASLVNAPALPATTLAESCYQSMFSGCASLVNAPALPATTLAESCYQSMFEGCTSLIYIKCLATDISATNCTLNWVSGITTDGVFVQASGATWGYGVSGIPETWNPVDAPQHDDGLWLRFYDGGSENPDYYEVSGSTSGDTYVFDTYEIGGSGLLGEMYLFYDGNYVFLDEVDICGYNCSDSECSVICGGEGGDDGEGNYIECNIMTGDTRFIIPTYQVMDITYTPASNMLSIQTHAEDCDGVDCSDWENMGYESYEDCDCQENGNCPEPDPGCCWDTRDPAVYKLCGCDFEGLVDQMVANWSGMDGGEYNLYIRYADDKEYYGEVVDGNGDTYAEIIFNQGGEEEIPVDYDNSVFVCFDTDEDCLELHTRYEHPRDGYTPLKDVYGFSLVAPSTCLCQICQDWEEKGYSNREECVCQEYYGGDCPDCMDNWYEMGYESYEDCMSQTYGECHTDCSDWENMGYSSYEECDCAENGNCEEGE